MPERFNPSNLLEAIPISVLNKLEPFRGRLDEVFKQQIDLAHLRNHNLDCVFLLRNFDLESARFKRQATILYWNDIAPQDYGERFELPDLPTFDRIERGLRLHDTGRAFVEMGVLQPEEHHFGSLFIASIVDCDPLVCEAVFHHVDDVLPKKSSLVTHWVQAFDRLVGAGYVGLTRFSISQGLNHPNYKDKGEEEIMLDPSLMASDQHGHTGENSAKKFFWENVYPFFQSQGDAGLMDLATYSKIVADRIVGRNYVGRRDLDYFERSVLKMDRNSRKVGAIDPFLAGHFSFKLKNTIEILIKARQDLLGKQDALSLGEHISYRN